MLNVLFLLCLDTTALSLAKKKKKVIILKHQFWKTVRPSGFKRKSDNVIVKWNLGSAALIVFFFQFLVIGWLFGQNVWK